MILRLYTIQPRFVYDALSTTGRFRSQPWANAPEWICTDAPAVKLAYDWMCQAMIDRGLPRPAPDIYPIWAWYQYMGAQKPKPDLRHRSMKSNGNAGRQVLLTLDLRDDQVLLHDYEAWHYPLNYFYLESGRNGDRFERQCKAAGAPMYDKVPLQNAALHAEVQRSWQAVFDLPRCRRLLGTRKDSQSVQATFWELHADYVRAAVEFGDGLGLRRLPLPGSQTQGNRAAKLCSPRTDSTVDQHFSSNQGPTTEKSKGPTNGALKTLRGIAISDA